jgi:hypothetical protein
VNLRVFEDLETLRRGAAESLSRQAALSLVPWFGATGDVAEILPIAALLPERPAIHWVSASTVMRDALAGLSSTARTHGDSADPLDLLLCSGPPPPEGAPAIPEAKMILFVALDAPSLLSWSEAVTTPAGESEERVWWLVTRETWDAFGALERPLRAEPLR